MATRIVWLLIGSVSTNCLVMGTAIAAASGATDIARITARGDIRRTRPPQPDEQWLPLYQGNGRLGGCLGPWGLHAHPDTARDYPLRGKTRFTHLRHHVRAKFNADYLLPVAAIYWEDEPRRAHDYEQHQSFYDGTILTRFRTDTYGVEVLSWIDPVRRDVVGLRIDVQGDCPAIVFAPLRKLSVHYGQQLEQTCSGQIRGQTWEATLRCHEAEMPLSVRSTAPLAPAEQGVRMMLRPGRNEILLGLGGEADVAPEESLRQTRAWWHSTWERSGWLDLPDDTAQKVWIRSLAYIFYSHNDDGTGCSPPDGLAGNAWPFPFPFDSGCRHPLLLWTGRIEVAQKWLEFWRSRADGLRTYTRRLWNRDGIMLPHVFPYGTAEDFHTPEPPNYCYSPVYNAGHLVRIAHQTAVMVNDPQWTKACAVPLIEGAARFYLSIATKGPDGLWHFTVTPSIGLDEDAPVNQPDYFCTLASAEYAFRRAVEYGLDGDGRMREILQDGVAWPALLSEQGLYRAHAGPGAGDFGRQKHPDQLTTLVHIPLGPEPNAPTKQSHALRYEITAGAKEPRFAGHTLGELILSSARMHDAAAWRDDWAKVQPAKYADPEWIQFYESSGTGSTYYVTTHGLFAQAILETVVSTWWERLDLAPCIPWSGRVRFGNLRTLLGVTVSGDLTDGEGLATLHAWKDTTLSCQGRTISLRAGEQTTVPVSRTR